MPTVQIMAATTAEATAEFTVSGEQRVTLASAGLAGAETIAISHLVGSTWVEVTDDDVAVTLTATSQAAGIDWPGRYKITKVETVGATGAQITY